jgi:SAM-dependent methyltransferase
MATTTAPAENAWTVYLERYRNGGGRAAFFRDLIVTDLDKIGECGKSLTLLDIGCGEGFDNDAEVQKTLAQRASQYIGVEPDPNIELRDIFTSIHRCRFEDAQIQPSSVDVAFAVMVLEHLPDPQTFWNKIHAVLRPGGIFWGFTVDARHWFAGASLLAKKLHLADWYLDMLHGKQRQERYKPYPVYYRSNTPAEITRLTKLFSTRTILNLQTKGQVDYYLPKRLRWLGRAIDAIALRRRWPGNNIAVRVTR